MGCLHCPSPSPPGFPHYSGLRPHYLSGLLPALPSVAVVAKPFINGSKGEVQPTAVAVGREVKKTPTSCWCFFISSGVHAATTHATTAGSSYPAPIAATLKASGN
ncbi:MAG: hypothetical protein FWB82_01680, partial [Treponema sp.]|nr:hypothetical protein [Treponema sp.]